jgi:hypothetical protein
MYFNKREQKHEQTYVEWLRDKTQTTPSLLSSFDWKFWNNGLEWDKDHPLIVEILTPHIGKTFRLHIDVKCYGSKWLKQNVEVYVFDYWRGYLHAVVIPTSNIISVRPEWITEINQAALI